MEAPAAFSASAGSASSSSGSSGAGRRSGSGKQRGGGSSSSKRSTSKRDHKRGGGGGGGGGGGRCGLRLYVVLVSCVVLSCLAFILSWYISMRGGEAAKAQGAGALPWLTPWRTSDPQRTAELLAAAGLTEDLAGVNKEIIKLQTELLLEAFPSLEVFSPDEQLALRQSAMAAAAAATAKAAASAAATMATASTSTSTSASTTTTGAATTSISNNRNNNQLGGAATDLLIARRQLELLLEQKGALARASNTGASPSTGVAAEASGVAAAAADYQDLSARLDLVTKQRAADSEELAKYQTLLSDAKLQLEKERKRGRAASTAVKQSNIQAILEAEQRGLKSARESARAAQPQPQVAATAATAAAANTNTNTMPQLPALPPSLPTIPRAAPHTAAVAAAAAAVPPIPPVPPAPPPPPVQIQAPPHPPPEMSEKLKKRIRKIAEEVPPLDPRTFLSAAPVKIDFACASHTQLKDRCACQIVCGKDRTCSGAAQLCKQLSECSVVKQNENKNKPVATLKKETAALFSLDATPQRWRAAFGQGERTFLIIGEQKCGTTQLYDALKAESWIQAPASDRKELHMFDHYHHMDACRINDYHGKFRRSGASTAVVGEATPDYLADPVAARLASGLLPAAKLVVMVRDPVRRAHAAWDQNRRAGPEERAFGQAVRDEWPVALRCRQMAHELAGWTPTNRSALARGALTRERLTQAYAEECAHYVDGSPANCWVNTRYDRRPACKRYLYKGFFGAHLRLWMQLFPARQFIVVDSDKYFSDASPVEEEVLKFLRDEMGVPRQRRSLLQQRAGGNAGAKTCWHNCETKKRSYKQDVDGPLESQLRALYAPDALLLQDSQKYVRWVR